ncbi:uncharacterized protein PAC_04863 [Phialocephala subalpina]|uniref:Zn(2)-C6 fungal-type domain-containing protein n=1 Tax=Phialocephala subalpina TaxID=576137 RepID=A0A1L7WQE2_9HELO|nr:uncharacterized protein PAC_04863 [Phialocephala subalpina]
MSQGPNMNDSSAIPAISAGAPPGEFSMPLRQPRKRRRPALSCNECRRRKVKCDQKDPCTQCVKSKNAVCKYDPDATPKAREANSTTISRHNTSKLLPRHNIDNPMPAGSTSLGIPATGPTLSNPRYPTANSFLEAVSRVNNLRSTQESENENTREPPHREESVQELKNRVRQLETMVSCMINPEQGSPAQDSNGPTNVFPKLRGSPRKARFFTMAHWMNIKGEFDQIHTWKKSTRDSQSSELNDSLRKCKQLARSIKSQRPTQTHPLPDFKSEIPARETTDLLVQLYFRSFESTYRVLHRPSFLKEYEQYWNDPTAASTTFTIKLLLVLCIGTIFTSDDINNSMRTLGMQWINTTQTYLNNPFEKSRLNLSSVEIQILLILARQTHSIGGDLLWISVGSLIRTAMSIGIHRDSSNFPKLPPFQGELRRRLWATILELAIQASLDCGMPPMISIEDYDCEPPSNYNDADFSEASESLPQAKPDFVSTETSIQRTLLKSLGTRTKIFKQINDFRSPAPGYEKILALSTELTSQLSSHSALYSSSSSSSPTFSTCQKNLLDLLTRRFLLALHLPFAILAKTDPRYYFSRKIALDTALLIFSYPSDPDFERMKLISGGQFREAFSRGSSAICLELIAQINEDSSPSFAGMPGVVNLARKGLHDAVGKVVLLSKMRLERGETNVKGFLFWSMIQAQTLAMESRNGDIQEEIGKGAKKAADEAYAILKKQIGYTPSSMMTPTSGAGGDSLMGTPGEMNVDWDALMQDTTMDFDFANTWLLDSWENV